MKYCLIIFFTFLLWGCEYNNTKNGDANFNFENLKKYQLGLRQKYNELLIESEENTPIDFINLYIKDDSLSKLKYSIKYQSDIYKFKNGKGNSVFYNELIHFQKSNEIDSAIKYIKENNTIDPFNLKLHRIYKVEPNTIICVNFLDFDIADYENFLMSQFNKSLNIEVINASY